MEIFRITIHADHPDSAAKFYSDLLGIEGRTVGGGRTYFDCGGVILAILAGEGRLPDYIYFAVGDLEAVYKRAKALGCLSDADVHGSPAGEIVTRPWGERSFYAADANGNGICFVDKNTLFSGRR